MGHFFFSLVGFIRDPIYKYFSGCLKANPGSLWGQGIATYRFGGVPAASAIDRLHCPLRYCFVRVFFDYNEALRAYPK